MSEASNRRALLEACGLHEAANATERALAVAGQVLEAIGDAIIFLDAEWRCRYVNRQASEIFGRDPNGLIGNHIWTEYSEGIGQELQLACVRAMREQAAVRLEDIRFPPRDRWFDSHIHPSPDGVAVLLRDATERHHAEAKRRAAEDLLREDHQARAQAERLAHLGFWRWDVATNRVRWSEELYRIYGIKEGEVELSFDAYLARVHPGDRARVQATIERALARSEAMAFEERVVRPDGEVRHLYSWGRVRADAQGAPTGMFGTCLDMTDLIQATNALRRSEEWLEIALDGGGVGLWDWNLRTNEVHWSEGTEKIFRVPSQNFEPSFDAYFALIHPDDRERVKATMSKSLGREGEVHIAHRVVDSDGAIRWVVGSGRVFRDASGKPVRVAGSVRDVTERRRAEDERRLFALLVERATDFIGIAGVDGRVHYVNAAGLRLVGLASVDEARTKRVGDFLTPEGLRQSLEVELPAVLAKGSWEGDGYLVHFQTKQEIPVQTTSFMVTDPATREPLCLATIHRDMTIRRGLEDRLRHAQKMEVVGRLAAGIAHDFNNLLTIILGMAGLMTRDPTLSDDARARLQDIEAAGQRAAALTRQLLTFGRRQMLEMAVLDLGAVVADASPLLHRLVPPEITLSLALGSEVAAVRADRGQIEQVLMNLVVNARDAMPEGGRLTIAVRVEPSHVILEVRDTGKGMDRDVRARIFEPFFTTKDPGRGTGLGLATAYAIVTQSGGEIAVESAPNEGASFTVRLPRSFDAPRTAAPKPSPSARKVALSTILLVDDEEDVRATVRAILADEGYRVLETSSAENALRMCATHADAIDLLITDIRMPNIDGRELAKRVRAIYPNVSVMLISGYAEEAPFPDATTDPIFAKPFSPDALAARVAETLAARERH